MNFEKLVTSFRDHAEKIADAKDPNVRFRINSYNRAANVIEANTDGKKKVTKEVIDGLNLTDYMKIQAMRFVDGTKSSKSSTSKTTTLRAKSPKSSAKSPTSRSKSPKSSAKSLTVNTAKLMKELTNFMGIGEERAKDLISAGLKHVNQLRMKKYYNLLPEETKIFITLKPLNQIPNEHIKILEPYLMKASDKNLALTIVGSYRRQKPFSSDIDVMVVSDNPDAIDLLHSRLDKILNGKIYPYSKGADKMSFIVDMSELVGEKNKIYKIDAFRTLPENAVPMLLYSTGSKEFNIIMRSRAKKQGYLLNQKGLFKDDKLVEGLNDEKAYFDILKMDYKEPKERI